MMLELRKSLRPVGAKFRHHAPLDKSPAHRRRLALQRGEFGGIFGRERIRYSGHELRHFHDRAFEPAERSGEFNGVAATVEWKPQKPCAGQPCRNTTHIGTNPCVTCGTR